MQEIVTAVSTTAAVMGIIFGALGYRLGVKNYNRVENMDARAANRGEGALKSDVDYIRRRIDDVLLEQRDTNKTLNELSERVTRVEESSKQAHKRLDGLEHRINGEEA